MGTTPVNAALGKLHGRIDDYVFREVENETIVARRSRGTKVLPSEAQMETRVKFKDGAEYATMVYADPAKKQWYIDLAAARGITTRRLFGFVLRNYVVSPKIEKIDDTKYHRHAGNPIRIRATDEGVVESVTVKLTKQSDGTLIEEGPAVYDAPSEWLYTAQTEAPAGIPLVVTVTAVNHARRQSIEIMGIMT